MATLPLDIARIYLESAVEQHARDRKILARFPEAERIPELRKGNPVAT